MDPSCGNCTGSDCSYSPGSTDPNCPEHGTRAQERREAELDAHIAALSRSSLRKLVHERRKHRHATRLDRPFRRDLLSAKPADQAIREASEKMVDQAKGGRRRTMLFTCYASKGRKPESGLEGVARLVYRHFKGRVRIVFREIWEEHDSSGLVKYDAWAVW